MEPFSSDESTSVDPVEEAPVLTVEEKVLENAKEVGQAPNVEGGYITHEGFYRVPDLLTETEFKNYMRANYGMDVTFTPLNV